MDEYTERVYEYYMGHSESNEIRLKILYFRQLVFNNILAPVVFDYGDSKSETWNRTKKFEKCLWSTNRLAHFSP